MSLTSGADEDAGARRLQVVDHRCGVDRGAVGERDPVADRDRPLRVVVVRLDRLGEHSVDLAVVAEHGDGVEERAGTRVAVRVAAHRRRGPRIGHLGVAGDGHVPTHHRAVAAGPASLRSGAPASSDGRPRGRDGDRHADDHPCGVLAHVPVGSCSTPEKPYDGGDYGVRRCRVRPGLSRPPRSCSTSYVPSAGSISPSMIRARRSAGTRSRRRRRSPSR